MTRGSQPGPGDGPRFYRPGWPHAYYTDLISAASSERRVCNTRSRSSEFHGKFRIEFSVQPANTKSRVATWISYDAHDLTKAKTDVHLRVGRIVAPDPGQRGKLGHRLFRSRHLVGLGVSSNRATPGSPPGHLAGWPQRLVTLDHVAEVAT